LKKPLVSLNTDPEKSVLTLPFRLTTAAFKLKGVQGLLGMHTVFVRIIASVIRKAAWFSSAMTVVAGITFSLHSPSYKELPLALKKGNGAGNTEEHRSDGGGALGAYSRPRSAPAVSFPLDHRATATK